MKRSRSIIAVAIPILCLIFVLLGVMALQPSSASAHGRIPANLVPCGRNIDDDDTTTLPGEAACTICDFWHLGDHIINFVIFGVLAPFLILMLVWGGFTYLTSGGDPKKVSQGSSIMTNAIIGLIISLAAWLIIDTIIKTLAAPEAFSPAWNEIKECPVPKEPPDIDISTVFPKLGTYALDYEARNILTLAGISINKQNCVLPLQTNCTSLTEIPQSTVQKLINLQNSCSQSGASACRFTVTGGTEAEHATHGPGKSVVDIAPEWSNPNANDYRILRDQAKRIGGLGTIAICETPAGTVSIDCGGADHIHIQFPR